MDKIMNLVNFVRGVEPREPEKDLFEPVVRELEVNRRYGFKSTVLLQYDALLRDDIRSLFSDREANKDVEPGLWFEMNRPLTEAVGIEWRGRPGYDWDWFVDPGFLMAYTPEERVKLIDEAFRKFNELFGFYPKVAGSWLLDAFSMKYMSEKYKLSAMCICREQFAVDAYTLWGGYYTGGYYPSVKNALCPAKTKDYQIDTPVFRMLGLDPIYGYDEARYPTGVWGCNTMEPVWTSGSDRRIMEWYMDVYYKAPCLSYAYATTGQENSFGWPCIEKGYLVQAELLHDMVLKGEVNVETLGETGERFKSLYSVTPACALTALKDRTDNGLKAVWYDSPSYRAGLIAEPGGRIFLRDLNVFDERYEERYLEKPCRSWDARYDNLPVVDNRLWSKDGAESYLMICEDADPSTVAASEEGDVLTVEFRRSGCCDKLGEAPVVRIEFRPDRIVFEGIDKAVYSTGVYENDVEIRFDDDCERIGFKKRGFGYYLSAVQGSTVRCADKKADRAVFEFSAAPAENETAGNGQISVSFGSD